TDLNKLGRVKLVSHCMHDKRYDNYVLREYLAYKVHNIITDYSFRVRLLNITYYDIDSKKLHANKTGFIIEPVKMLGERFGKKELEDIQIMPGDIEDELLLKLSVFQYLIANSDWDVPMMHNVKIFGNKDAPHELIAVPYDFDFTGWVDSHYAVARTDLGLEEITDRAFFGPCRDEEDYRPVLDYFLELENNIIDTIKDFEYLKGGEKRALLWFVKDFYRLYRKDEIMNIFMEACSNK
ncbi:MAG: hypothetical protein KFF49_08390, partial [Bacteroidales bacterium]|nr:hypothetical protein [Bacteroidales bacterium]